MPDQELHKDYPELMSRYLSGNATDADVQQLEAWVLEDPEHRQQFMAFKKAWMLSGMKEVAPAIDVESKWQETAGQLFPTAKEVPMRPRSRTYRWLGMAAAIALVVGLSIWALLTVGKETEVYFAASESIRTIALPDGSAVTLNRASSLRYTPVSAEAEDGQAAQRLVTLEGDAFFDVERDTDRPFIINSGTLEVEVLGTSFYIDARAEQTEVQVIVASGAVAVRAPNTDTLNLEAGQKGIYQKTADSLYVEQNEDENFQSIKTGKIVFENSTLEEITFALSRHYKVEIDYTGIEDTGNCSIDGDYDNFSLEEILELLVSTWEVEWERVGDRILLRGGGCR